jgi:hypothetical protein
VEGGAVVSADRPTREQVDAALSHADLWQAGTSTPDVLAAEVRALRADLDVKTGQLAAARRIGSRLAARTPQPAEQDATERSSRLLRLRQALHEMLGFPQHVGFIADDEQLLDRVRVRITPAPLPAVPDGSVTLDELSQPDPSLALVTDRTAAIERMADAAARWPEGSDAYVVPVPLGWLRALSVPAVPDGEAATARRRWAAWLVESASQADDLTEREAQGMRIAATHLLDDEIAARVAGIDGLDDEWLVRFTERLHDRIEAHRFAVRTVRAAASSGEDVPARLDAAADAIQVLGWSDYAENLRDAAAEHRHAPPDVRAAVAAALARPTEETP